MSTAVGPCEKTVLFEARQRLLELPHSGPGGDPGGVVLAYCEAREGRGDWDPIDILMRRSHDGATLGAAARLGAACRLPGRAHQQLRVYP